MVVDELREMLSIPIDGYTDRLLHLAKDRKCYPIKNPETFENILEKQFQLTRTVTYLILQRSRLDKGSYTYILDKYMEQVNLGCYVSKLLYDNVRERFPNETSVVYNSFLVQHNTFVAHRDELVANLDIENNEPFELEDLLQLSLLREPALREMLSLQQPVPQRDIWMENATSSIALISDEQARNFLLENVFSISKNEI